MTDEEILKRACWNKNTSYPEQITFIGDDGFHISVVRTFPESFSRKQAEKDLVELVKEHYGY